MITAVLLVVSLLFGVLPAGADPYVVMFQPVLFFAVLDGILSGPLYALALGVLSPLLSYFLFPGAELVPDTITSIVACAAAGLVSGILYEVFFSSVGSSLVGLLVWLFAFGLTKFICLLAIGDSYFILDFFSDTILALWPGLLLTLLLVPILVVFLRKRGAMWVLRHERED